MRAARKLDEFDEQAPTTIYDGPRKRPRRKSLEEIAAGYEAAVAPFVTPRS